MSFLKNIFGQSKPSKSNDEIAIHSVQDFWDWFVQHEQDFYRTVKNNGDIENAFFNILSPKLRQLHNGIFFLVGMSDENTAELILTPDGKLKNITFTEKIVEAAPHLPNWKFTAMKPATQVEFAAIQMGDFTFSKDNLHFYSNEHTAYPDEIDITIVYDDYDEPNKELIANGVYIFLDNYLGEQHSITMIDNVQITSKDLAEKDLVPMEKLKDFLLWREKEFIEKYEADYYESEEDNFTMYEAELENGLPLLATMNTTVLDWDSKPSHPYIIRISIDYKSDQNGLPTQEIFDLMNAFEDVLIDQLPNKKGYLHIGRQTGDGLREIYFVSKEFRHCSEIVSDTMTHYADRLKIDYDIYKDKYWQTFERFSATKS